MDSRVQAKASEPKIRYQSYLILSEPSKKPYLFLHKIRYRELVVSVEIITGKGV